MSDDATDEDLGEQLDRQADDIRHLIEKNPPRPAVDAEHAERLLEVSVMRGSSVRRGRRR